MEGTGSRKSCVYKGKEYNDGAVIWGPDDCIVCSDGNWVSRSEEGKASK